MVFLHPLILVKLARVLSLGEHPIKLVLQLFINLMVKAGFRMDTAIKYKYKLRESVSISHDGKIIAVGDHLRDGNGMVNTGAVNVYEQSTVRAIPLTNDSAATFEIEGNYYVGNKLSIEEVNTDEDGEGSGYTHIWELRDGGSTNWVEVGRGTSFTLNNNLNFLSDVRVRTSYTDAQGFEEDVLQMVRRSLFTKDQNL